MHFWLLTALQSPDRFNDVHSITRVLVRLEIPTYLFTSLLHLTKELVLEEAECRNARVVQVAALALPGDVSALQLLHLVLPTGCVPLLVGQVGLHPSYHVDAVLKLYKKGRRKRREKGRSAS